MVEIPPSRYIVEGAARTEAFSLWLDLFRWAAAFAVLVTHSGSRLLADVTSLPAAHRSIVHLGFQFLAGFSNQAVMVFFVLSGFLVGGSVVRELESPRSFRFGPYLIKRVARLAIVLWPILLIGGLLDHLGVYGFHGLRSGVYDQWLLDRADPGTALCNAAFLQTFFCLQFGTNGALWSIASEFWYYILFPLALLPFYCRTTFAVRVLIFLGMLFLAGVLSVTQHADAPLLLPYMVVWLLGVAASIAGRPFLVRSPTVNAALLVGFLLLVRVFVRQEVKEIHPVLEYVLDVGVGIFFANLICAMKISTLLMRPAGGHVHRNLAGFSYSLYCIHTPVIHFYAAVLVFFGIPAWHQAPVSLTGWLVVFGGLATALAFAYLVSLITERHTPKLRTLLFRLFYLRAEKEPATQQALGGK